MEKSVNGTASRRLLALQILGAIAFVTAAVWGIVQFGIPDLADFRAWAEQTGRWFPLVFFIAYALFTVFPTPRSVFTIACGVLFTPAVGITIAVAGTAVSGALSFLMVRFVAGDRVQRWLPDGLLSTVHRRLQARGWLAVGSMRMIPAIPFAPLSYALALTGIKFWPYLLATIIGSAPNTIAVILFTDALTGGQSPSLIILTAILVALGIIGLIIDMRLPTPDDVKDKS